jgi:hypothetical protein
MMDFASFPRPLAEPSFLSALYSSQALAEATYREKAIVDLGQALKRHRLPVLRRRDFD